MLLESERKKELLLDPAKMARFFFWHILFKIFFIIHWAVSGLGCSMWDLVASWGSLVCGADSPVVARGLWSTWAPQLECTGLVAL